jgi:hypothetical protein
VQLRVAGDSVILVLWVCGVPVGVLSGVEWNALVFYVHNKLCRRKTVCTLNIVIIRTQHDAKICIKEVYITLYLLLLRQLLQIAQTQIWACAQNFDYKTPYEWSVFETRVWVG